MKPQKIHILLYLFLCISCTKEYTAPVETPHNPESPKQLEKTLGLIVLTALNTAQTIVYHIDTLHQIKDWKFLQGDFFDARIDCERNMLYYFPKSIGKMQAIDMNSKEPTWTLSLTNAQTTQWFRGIDVIQNELYVADYDGYVNVYDDKKRTQKSFHVLDNYMTTHFLHYDYITYTFQQPRNNSQHKRIVNYNFGLNIVCNMIFDCNLIKWFVQDKNETLLFYNEDKNAGISVLYYLSAGISTIRTISSEKMIDVCRIAQEQFIVATNRRLYLYNHADRSLSAFLEKENITQLEWNSLTSLLAISAGNEISVYSLSQKETVQQYTLPYEIKKFFWNLSY